MRTILSFLRSLAFLVVLPAVLTACPNCKEAYMATDGSNVSAGYNASIFFMIGMPLVVFFAVSLRIWLSTRRHNQTHSA